MSGIKRHKKLVVVLVLVLAFFLWKTWDTGAVGKDGRRPAWKTGAQPAGTV